MAETRSLHRKLAQVMHEATTIPKTGVAPAAMGGFKFVEAGVAADFIRKALADQSITMVPTSIEILDSTEHETSGKKVMTTLTVRTTWTLTDAETGETTQIQSLGQGADMGDKAAPKAQTNAMKYAILMGFLLSTGDDPERVDTSDRQVPVPRNGTLIGVAEVAKPPHDFQLREGPTGPSIGFGLKEGRQIVRVVAHGPLASALHLLQGDVIGQRVTTFGVVEPDVWVINKGKDNERRVPYLRQTLERIQTPSGTLPSTSGQEAPDDAPEAQAASGGSLGGPPDALDEIAALPMFQEPAA